MPRKCTKDTTYTTKEEAKAAAKRLNLNKLSVKWCIQHLGYHVVKTK